MASVILKWLVYSRGPKVAYFFGLDTSLLLRIRTLWVIDISE